MALDSDSTFAEDGSDSDSAECDQFTPNRLWFEEDRKQRTVDLVQAVRLEQVRRTLDRTSVRE
jgi:hypothetical protein